MAQQNTSRGYARFGPVADQAAQKYGVPPDLLKSIITAESAWNPKVTSGAGAVGIAQLMPATAASLGVDPRDPEASIDGAARYLGALLQHYGGDEQKATAAYNAGPGRVDQAGGVPNIPETQNYVAKVQGLRGAFSSPTTGAAGGNAGGSVPQSLDQRIAAAMGGGAPPSSDPNAAGASDLTQRSRANLSGLQKPLLKALVGAHTDLAKQGINLAGLITSGFRSRDEQTQLYQNRAANPLPVAPPGRSNHETGNAVDIALTSLPPDQQQTVLKTLRSYGLGRPVPGDPVHFEMRPGAAQAQPQQRPTIDQRIAQALSFSQAAGNPTDQRVAQAVQAGAAPAGGASVDQRVAQVVQAGGAPDGGGSLDARIAQAISQAAGTKQQ